MTPSVLPYQLLDQMEGERMNAFICRDRPPISRVVENVVPAAMWSVVEIGEQVGNPAGHTCSAVRLFGLVDGPPEKRIRVALRRMDKFVQNWP